MIQNPAVPHNTRPTTFPLVSAEACTCCGRALSQGYDVPYIGVVGPRCVRKFAPLAHALITLERTEFASQLTGERGEATQRVFYGLRRLGFGPKADTAPDGTCTIVISKLPAWRNAAKVCKSWRETRAEFERDLQVAGGHQVAQPVPVAAPVLTTEAVAALPLPERRALAVEHGVLTPGGKASTDARRIWAAMQAAQVAEAQAVAEVAPLRPVLVLENPETGPVFLPYQVGPFRQVEQRHYAGPVAEAALVDALPTVEEVIAELVTCVEAQAAVDLALDSGTVEGDIVRQEEVATRSLNWLMDLPGTHLRRLGAQAARDAALLAAYEEALTPSAGTKYAYSGEFRIEVEELDEEGDPTVVRHDVDWTTLKDVLAAVRARVQAHCDGPHEQPEQQAQQRLAAAPRFHAPLPERLHRVALALKAHEVQAEPGSPERVLRGLRADRMAGLAWAARAGLERHSQPEQRHFAQAPVVLVDCAECEGKGWALYRVGREQDGTPVEARRTCEVCHGEGKVPVVCPECLGGGVALVESDFSFEYHWCLKCALEAIAHGDRYTTKQVVEIRAQAAAAGLLVPQPQPEQQQLTRQSEREWLQAEWLRLRALEPSEQEQALTRYQTWLGPSQYLQDLQEGLRMAQQAAVAVECNEIAYRQKEDRALAALAAGVVTLSAELVALKKQLRAPVHSPFSTTRMDTRDLLLITRGFSLGLYKTGYTRGQFMEACEINSDADMNHLMALIVNIEDRARELSQDGPHQQEEQQQAQGRVQVELGGTGYYAADLYGQTSPDIYARLEVNELQEADPKHMPVILHLPSAMLLELSEGGDEADVTLNMTALEARVLSDHLLKAAQAAEGGVR